MDVARYRINANTSKSDLLSVLMNANGKCYYSITDVWSVNGNSAKGVPHQSMTIYFGWKE